MSIKWAAWTLLLRWADKKDKSAADSLKDLYDKYLSSSDSPGMPHLGEQMLEQVKEVAFASGGKVTNSATK